MTTIGGPQAGQVERVAIAGDHIAWSLSRGGVYRVPLTGGVPEQVPGSEGLQVLSWPWAADAAAIRHEPTLGNQTKMINLESGEKRSIEGTADLSGVRCGPTFCYGDADDNGLPVGVVQGIDGSNRRQLPGLRSFGGEAPIADRFALFNTLNIPGHGPNVLDGGDDASLPVAAIYDRVSGKVGGIGVRHKDGSGGFGTGTSSSPSLVFYWGVDDSAKPDEYWVLNLAAVPPAE